MDDETRKRIRLFESNFHTAARVRSQSNYSIDSTATAQNHGPVSPTSIQTGTNSVIDVTMPKSFSVGPSDILFPAGSLSPSPQPTRPSSVQIGAEAEEFPDPEIEEDIMVEQPRINRNLDQRAAPVASISGVDYIENVQNVENVKNVHVSQDNGDIDVDESFGAENKIIYDDQDAYEDSYKYNKINFNKRKSSYASRSSSLSMTMTGPVSQSAPNPNPPVDSLANLKDAKSGYQEEKEITFDFPPSLEYLADEKKYELSHLSDGDMIYESYEDYQQYPLQPAYTINRVEPSGPYDLPFSKLESLDSIRYELDSYEPEPPEFEVEPHSSYEESDAASDASDTSDTSESSETSYTYSDHTSDASEASDASDTDSVGTSKSLHSVRSSHQVDTMDLLEESTQLDKLNKLDTLSAADASDDESYVSDESDVSDESHESAQSYQSYKSCQSAPNRLYSSNAPDSSEYREQTAPLVDLSHVGDIEDIEIEDGAGTSHVPDVSHLLDTTPEISGLSETEDEIDASDSSDASDDDVSYDSDDPDAPQESEEDGLDVSSDDSEDSDESDDSEGSGDSGVSDESDDPDTIDADGSEHSGWSDADPLDKLRVPPLPACVEEELKQNNNDSDGALGALDTLESLGLQTPKNQLEDDEDYEEFEDYLDYHVYVYEDERQGSMGRPPDGPEHRLEQRSRRALGLGPANPFTRSRTFTQRVRNYRDKNYKIYLWIPVMCSMFLMLALFGFDDEVVAKNGDMVIAIIIICSKMVWAILFIPAVLTTERLRYFRTLECRFDKFSDVSVPYGVREFPKRAVVSVSSMLQLRGTFWQSVSYVDSIVALILTALAILTKWDRFDSIPGGKIAAVLSYLGHYGFFTAAVWELNNDDQFHMSLHYVGCGMMSLGPVAFGMIHEFSWESITLGVVSASFIILWLLCSTFLPIKSDNPVTVHRVSLICISCQLMSIATAGISLCSYLVMLHLY